MTHVAKYGVAPIVEKASVGGTSVAGPIKLVYVPYFDAVDNYIRVLPAPLDMTADIDLSFTVRDTVTGSTSRIFYAQGVSGGVRELSVGQGVPAGQPASIIVVLNTTTVTTPYRVQAGDTIRVTVVGTQLTIYANGIPLTVATVTRGINQANSVGRIGRATVFTGSMLGALYNFRFNQYQLPLYGNNVASYASIPEGLVGTPFGFVSTDFQLAEVL